MDKVYTVSEAAKELGFSRQTILSWIEKGKIEAFRGMRNFRISESEIKRIKGEKI